MGEEVLGVLGGIGPLATIYFTDMVINMTDAKMDQEHIPMVIFNNPQIPDRTEYILDNSKPNPLPVMIKDAIKLENVGCDYIVIPCNTAHYFYSEIQKNVSVPIINIIKKTVEYIKNNQTDVKCIGILATQGTIVTGSYQKEIIKNGLDYKVPDEKNQKSLMNIIYNGVKAGEEVDVCEFLRIVDDLKHDGCDAVILGCTELSVINKSRLLVRNDIVDSLEVLARISIELCGKRVKDNALKMQVTK
ncbi:MAG TPA: amino acid racemase [Clostridia bacterium]|nr:amino acid racemase [Clostridia bacterium]